MRYNIIVLKICCQAFHCVWEINLEAGEEEEKNKLELVNQGGVLMVQPEGGRPSNPSCVHTEYTVVSWQVSQYRTDHDLRL